MKKLLKYFKSSQFLKLIIVGCALGGMIAMVGSAFFGWTLTTAILWQLGTTIVMPFLVPLIAGLILGIGILTGRIL